ncbi:MAG: ABC transporter ATP-binding protein [Alphaproteobacteria bacterium]|nr:ABC transporter ATP-binding protein [Alphaproteobacteria bacterium]
MPAQAANSLPDNAIEAHRLDKVYAAKGGGERQHALKAIDLTIPRGSLFGLLGPNGAGKSTFINILAGLVLKTSGKVHVWGMDIDDQARNARAAIGIVPQELNLDAFFTPREMLEVQAGLYGVPARERRTMEILDKVGLVDKADAYARSLSGGMRRRLLVAKAMVHNAPILVLDEPTAGVDIELRQQLWASVREMNDRGTTILLTTHYLEEAEKLCDTIAIINHGRVIACEATQSLIGRIDDRELELTVAETVHEVPPALTGLHIDMPEPQRFVVRYQTKDISIGEILKLFGQAGLTISDLKTREPDLEDTFLALTRRPAVADQAPDSAGTGS